MDTNAGCGCKHYAKKEKKSGTIRGNGFEKIDFKYEKELKKQNRGSFDYRVERNDNIYLLRWLDGGIVQLLSSIHGHEPMKEVSLFCVEKKKKSF